MIAISLLNTLVIFLAFLAQDKRFRPMLKLAFAILAVVLGVRYGYGNDYFSYYDVYNNSFSGWDERQEYGWYILNVMAHPIGFMGLVFILSCIEHYMLYDLINRYVTPKWYWLAVFLYVFSPVYMLVGCSMMRQFLVTLLGFYALELALKKKVIYFIILICLALLIHKVAILYAPFCAIPYIKVDKIKPLWLFIILLLAISYIYVNLDILIFKLSNILTESGFKYANSYLSDTELLNEHKIPKKTIVHYLIYVYLMYKNIQYLSKEECVLSIEVLAGCLILVFALAFTMAGRTAWVYTTAEILAIPILFKHERRLIVKHSLLILLILITLLDYIDFFHSEIYSEHYKIFHTIFSASQII